SGTLMLGLALSGAFFVGATATKPNGIYAIGHAELPTLQDGPAIERLKREGLYASLQQALDTTRYEVRRQQAPAAAAARPAYYTSNPAQQLVAYFTDGGLRVAPNRAARKDAEMSRSMYKPTRAAETPEWEAGMKLIGYGHGED